MDNLSENVQRGIRQKLRRGEFPGRPILGYKNEPRLRTIVLDDETAPLIKKMFEAYATNRYSVSELRDLVTSWGLRTTMGNPITRSNMWNLLAHPFYIGLIRYNGELYEGSHPAIVPKDLFEKVQKFLKEKLDIKDQMGKLGSRGNFRIGPARRFYDQAIQATKIARDENLEKIRNFFRSVGSGLTFAARRARCEWEKTWSILTEI